MYHRVRLGPRDSKREARSVTMGQLGCAMVDLSDFYIPEAREVRIVSTHVILIQDNVFINHTNCNALMNTDMSCKIQTRPTGQ